MTSTGLLVAGGGLGALTVVRALRALGDERAVTVLAGEAGAPYDRPPLSKQVLAGSMEPHEAALLVEGEELNAELLPGLQAVRLAPDRVEVTASDGTVRTADDLVIATGARVRELPIAVRGAVAGVHYLRTLEDALALRREALEARQVIVIGAGFIGLEVAATLRGMGAEVTVLEAADVPLGRVLGAEAGRLVADLHAAHGVRIECGCQVSGLRADDGRVSGVELADGTVLPGQVVVVGIGVIPETEWLDGSRVAIDNGVVCDAGGRTTRERVWAVGDVSRWPNSVTGLHIRVEQWQSALDQAQVVAANLAAQTNPEVEARVWDSIPYFWSDQYDAKIQFAGHPGARSEVVWQGDRPIVLFGDEQSVSGLLVVTNPRMLAKGRRLLASGGSWEAFRELVG